MNPGDGVVQNSDGYDFIVDADGTIRAIVLPDYKWLPPSDEAQRVVTEVIYGAHQYKIHWVTDEFTIPAEEKQ